MRIHALLDDHPEGNSGLAHTKQTIEERKSPSET